MSIFKRKEEKQEEVARIEPGAAPITCYLAGPFAGLDISEAVNLHRQCAAHLVRMGYAVISPILNSVPIWLTTKDEVKTPWWENLEPRLVDAVDVFVVILATASFYSAGVRRELEMAEKAGKIIRGIVPLEDDRFVIVDLPHVLEEDENV